MWSHQRTHQRRRRSHQSSQDALLNLVCSVSSEKEITTLQEPMDCHCAFKSHSCAPAMTLYLHWKLFNLVIYSTSPLISDDNFWVTVCRTELLDFPSGIFSRYRSHLSWTQGQPWHRWSPWHLCLLCFLLACVSQLSWGWKQPDLDGINKGLCFLTVLGPISVG